MTDTLSSPNPGTDTLHDEPQLRSRRQHFIETYAACFLAAEASRERERAELAGTSHSYGRNQPVEDAFYLAGRAWENIVDLDQLKRAN